MRAYGVGWVHVQILDIFAFMFMLYPRYIRQARFVDFIT
jgi:hypothetical protein